MKQKPELQVAEGKGASLQWQHCTRLQQLHHQYV